MTRQSNAEEARHSFERQWDNGEGLRKASLLEVGGNLMVVGNVWLVSILGASRRESIESGIWTCQG
jgi:hypothetical protein